MAPAVPPPPFASILEGALSILREPDPHVKAALADSLARAAATLPLRPASSSSLSALVPPAKPARLPLPTVDPSKTPRRGKGGTLASRAAMLHALVHIESWAIDLAADCIARFACGASSPPFPRALATDFCVVCADEARHFSLLEKRLHELGAEAEAAGGAGYTYGSFPVHDGLWESAERTSGSLAARLAVEHCTHEARGLDVLPSTIAKFRRAGDHATADLLENVVYPEEVRHCAAGVRWLAWMHASAAGLGGEEAMRRACAAAGPPEGVSGGVEEAVAAAGAETQEAEEQEPEGQAGEGEGSWRADAAHHATPAAWFRALVARHFYGNLRPPFNEEARAKAGFTREWYWPKEEEAAVAAGERGGDGGEDGDTARRRDDDDQHQQE